MQSIFRRLQPRIQNVNAISFCNARTRVNSAPGCSPHKRWFVQGIRLLRHCSDKPTFMSTKCYVEDEEMSLLPSILSL